MKRAYMETFGEFICRKRISHDITLRAMADRMGVSAVYISDVEKGRRNAPDMEKLEKIASILELDPDEKTLLFDLAGEQRDQIAPDIPAYIRSSDMVTCALRAARDLGAGDNEWQKFIDDLKRRKE